jgi:hypothetical protein
MKISYLSLFKDLNIERRDLGNFSLLLGSQFLLFTTSLLVLVSASLALRLQLNVSIIVFSILVSLCITYWGVNIYFIKNRLLIFSIIAIPGVLLFIFFLRFSGSYYDFSWDGQGIHQDAIILLSKGWNPFTDILTAADNKEFIGLNHYTRGGWYPAAIIYKATGHIEQSKVFNFTFILTTFFFCFAALVKLKDLNYISALLISLLLSLNPISICQSLTFYIDGQLASALISMVAVGLIIFYDSNKFTALLYGCLIIILFNIKFTGVIYSVIFSGALGLLILYYKKTIPFYSHLKTSIFYSIFALLLIGYSPYVINTVNYGHPMYPVLGQKDNRANNLISTVAMPANFNGMNRVEMFWYSIFSKSVWSRAPLNAQLKIPFTTSLEELEYFHRADVELSALGPYFSGILTISLLLTAVAFIKMPKQTSIAFICILIISASVFINPLCWMGRYVPQLWLIPLIIVILFMHQKQIWSKTISFILIIIISANIYLIMEYYYNTYSSYSNALKNEFYKMKSAGKPIPVYFGGFKSGKVKFEEMGVKYQEVKSIKDLNTAEPYYLNGNVCINRIYNP